MIDYNFDDQSTPATKTNGDGSLLIYIPSTLYKVVYLVKNSQLTQGFCVQQTNTKFKFDDVNSVYDPSNYPQIIKYSDCKNLPLFQQLPNLATANLNSPITAFFETTLFPLPGLNDPQPTVPGSNIACKPISKQCGDIQQDNFIIDHLDTKLPVFYVTERSFPCGVKCPKFFFTATPQQLDYDDDGYNYDDDDDEEDNKKNRAAENYSINGYYIEWSDETLAALESFNIEENNQDLIACQDEVLLFLENRCNPEFFEAADMVRIAKFEELQNKEKAQKKAIKNSQSKKGKEQLQQLQQEIDQFSLIEITPQKQAKITKKGIEEVRRTTRKNFGKKAGESPRENIDEIRGSLCDGRQFIATEDSRISTISSCKKTIVKLTKISGKVKRICFYEKNYKKFFDDRVNVRIGLYEKNN